MLIGFHCTKKSSFQQQMRVVHFYDKYPKLKKPDFYREYGSIASWK